ncbi:MAG: glycoside hydrolase family 15 protein [Sedimentisphaerales bacterium]|nr:glycoside hydrolase family 15 protein [Sedimentisphaerales bacterium]
MKKLNIKKLIEISEKVISDGSLENGAIVAANSDKEIYPSNVQDYRYVWVRDAAYVCMAADLLNLEDIPEKFFSWCLNRAENFKQTGLFSNAYNVNGTIHGTLVCADEVKVLKKAKSKYVNVIHQGTQFQPDQNGSLLIAVSHHIKHFRRDVSVFRELIETTAQGICISWRNRRFSLPCFDLWEERCILPEQRKYHIYSLAMCSAGLKAVIELLPNKRKWQQTQKEMSEILEQAFSYGSNSIPRTYNQSKTEIIKEDMLPDTSLLGLVYPSQILHPLDDNMQKTVQTIIRSNTVKDGGLLRYPGDKYCGRVKNGWVALTGAGSWPLLSFWMSIYFSFANDKQNAVKYFKRPLYKINEYIPEQIFENKKQSSVTPLLWSHAMFIIAAKFMGHL